jgi:NhaP-type Na+/H+ or K+/H+ antiporter
VTGVGLILALAAGSQVLASRLRIPAIIVLPRPVPLRAH